MIQRKDILQDIAQTLTCDIKNIPGDLNDKELDAILGVARGTSAVKRCKGSLTIPSYKVGRSRRTPLSAVIKFKLDQISKQTDNLAVTGGQAI